MILDELTSADHYLALHPQLRLGFEFLCRAVQQPPAPGRYELVGDAAYVIVERTAGRGRSGARLEAHRKYLDIQVALAGHEEIGWRPLNSCCEITEPYDDARDIAFYADSPTVWLPLARGQFMIFLPQDAHAPLAGTGEVTKAVVKIALV